MGTLKWYKRDPRAALIGMMGLTLEETGAYNTILDLIYVHDGALEDDARAICSELGCNIQRWRRLKARLLDLGKLYVDNGCLRNERADREVANIQKLIRRSKFKAIGTTKRKQDYQDYLASEEWQEKRREILTRDRFKCRHCGNDATEVHHLTYVRIFREELDDLVSVCRNCHQDIHDATDEVSP
jgi:5-methylcytosine-specific restriction endonuclease McrA